MKNIFYLMFLLLLLGCSSDNSWDCAQTAGEIVQQEISVAEFNKILVWERTKLFVQQGEVQKVIIETGKNLMSDIEVSVTDGRLEIHNNNACNLLRDYGITKVFVTTPDLTEIRSSTGLPVESIGKLRFHDLTLLSEDSGVKDEYHVDGDFKMDLEVENLTVTANGLSNFYLKGTATNAIIGLYAGDCRVFSEDLIVQELQAYHRSTGVMVVNPQKAIRGQIVSLGNIVSKNRPAIVEVEELYRGRLIFE